MVNSRGAAHLEMVVSFVFFISFVLFLFVVLKPYETTTISANVVEGVEASFQREVKINYSRVFVRTDDVVLPPNCRVVPVPPEMLSQGLTNSRVEHLSSEVDSEADSDEISIEWSSIGSNNASLILEVSPEFVDESLPACFGVGHTFDEDNVTFGSVFEKELVSFDKLVLLKERYDVSYDLLKLDLGIPEVFDFSITSDDFPQLDMVRDIPSSVSVSVDEGVFEVLNSSGVITNARFRFAVW
jgi:hypothetical protein